MPQDWENDLHNEPGNGKYDYEEPEIIADPIIQDFIEVIEDYNDSGLNLNYEVIQENKLLLFNVTEHQKEVLSEYFIKEFDLCFTDSCDKYKGENNYLYQF